MTSAHIGYAAIRTTSGAKSDNQRWSSSNRLSSGTWPELVADQNAPPKWRRRALLRTFLTGTP